MRFLADENVSRFVIERLRAAGFEVTWIGMSAAGASDADVLAIASREGLVLITEDRDFGEMVVRQGFAVHGLVLLELDRLSNAAEADFVTAIVSAHADKLSGNLLVIEPGRVRIRPLPR